MLGNVGDEATRASRGSHNILRYADGPFRNSIEPAGNLPYARAPHDAGSDLRGRILTL